ncbi:MAG TPA: endonuclease domain-containing protein [Roseiarcus sp.]
MGGRALARALAPAARALRRNATSAERRLWQVLRRKQVGGFRFRRQVILGGFVADFACLEARLVLEVDGATHGTDDQVTRDLMRTDALGAQGFAVLRFTNDDVYRNLDDVAETIARKLAELRPRVEDSAC